MKTIVKASLVTAAALTSANAVSNAALAAKLNSLESELSSIKAKLKKQNKKLNKVKSHDSNDNIKWGVDFRTEIDYINYDMADGSTRGKNDLMSNRLWLNMAYAPNPKNVFKGQLSYNKAFGAQFGQNKNPTLTPFGVRGTGFDTFDWISNEALTDDSIKVRQAYWLYLGDKFFGADIPWTFSIGRRPSTGGFLANLRNDDAAQSPLGHIINVNFDGLSSKLDLSNVTGVPGMSFKLCMGQGSTNAAPRLGNLSATDYQNDAQQLEDTKLGGFIFEPYNDGQFIVKTTAFKAFDMPGFDSPTFFQAFAESQGAPVGSNGPAGFSQVGNMYGAAISVLVDGLGDDGILADTKVFGSFAWSKTDPDAGQQMLGLTTPFGVFGANPGEAKSGTSYWLGTQVPVTENGKFGLEYNHGSKYWRSYDYAEDTFAGSKLAARGDAWETYFTYQLTDALSAQIRYTSINYDYTGSNGFFASGGTPFKISDIKAGAAQWAQAGGANLTAADMGSFIAGTPNGAVQGVIGNLIGAGATQQQAAIAGLAAAMAPSIVEKAQDVRFYIRYRF